MNEIKFPFNFKWVVLYLLILKSHYFTRKIFYIRYIYLKLFSCPIVKTNIFAVYLFHAKHWLVTLDNAERQVFALKDLSIDIQTVPLTMVQLMIFFTLHWYKSDMRSIETVLWILNCGTILCWDAGQHSKLQLPVSHTITRVNKQSLTTLLYPDNKPVFHFQWSINYTRYSSIFHKIGFVWDDFAHL